MTALRDAGALSGFYLADGTSLALRFAHRASEYLDCFRPDDLDTEDLLARLRAAAVPLVVDHQDAGTLRLAIGPEGVRVEFFRYRYPTVQPLEDREGVALAHPIDVGLMKLIAVSSRGSR